MMAHRKSDTKGVECQKRSSSWARMSATATEMIATAWRNQALQTGCETASIEKDQRKGIFMAERAQSHTPGPNKLPARYLQFQKRYPRVFQAYNALGAATSEAGPLTDKTRALVKLAIAVGGQMEGAVHSHTRRALEAGGSAEEIYHVVLLGTTTLGFPTMMKTFSCVAALLAHKG